MAFVDELKIYARAGDGGDGVVRWRREKFIARGGPAGGDGGKGGNVYALAVRDINILRRYKFKKEFKAQNGENGRSKSQHGRDGEDLIIKVPIGSVIKNLKTEKEVQLLEEGEKVLLLKGGIGGYGNEHFKSATNRAPKEWTPGKPGEEAEFFIELQLIADLGLIGLPNAGKSSLLNAITAAQAKTAEYPFTTLEPNLGVLPGGYIVADIPGLIEGASEGKGLGIKFLRHIKRTRLLAHLISFEQDNPMKIYKTVRKELENYSKELSEKEEVVVLTKTDVVDEKLVAKRVEDFDKLGLPVFAISLYDDQSIKHFQDEIIKLLRRKGE